MSTIDILINKVQELTAVVNAIQTNSKGLNQLPVITGDDIYFMATNGQVTGRYKLANDGGDDNGGTFQKWKNVEFFPETSLELSVQNSSFNLEFNPGQWAGEIPNLKGFEKGVAPDGLQGFIRNGGSGPMLLKHNDTKSPNVALPFYLSSGRDYLIAQDEILSFKYTKDRNRCEVSIYNDAVVPLRPYSEVYVLTERDLSNSGAITISLENVPSQSDFISVYCNGVFINPKGVSVVDNYVLIDRKKVEYSFKEGMKITINYKF